MSLGVLHICDYAAAYKGGFINALEFLRKDIEKDGIKQIYLFPERANRTNAKKWIEELRCDGAIVYVQSRSFIKNIFLLRQIIKKHNVKKIFRHFNDLKIDVIERVFCSSTPVVRFFQCTYNASGFSHRLRTLIYKKDVIVGVSKFVTDNALKAFPGRDIKTLPHALSFDRLNDVDSFPKQNKISCLAVGYNIKVKGVDLTFDAFRRVREKRDVLLYVVVASHQEEFQAEIEKSFGNKPDWLTVLPPTEKIGTYYHNTDVILSPSRSEGALPFVVFEAMCCGSVAVVSDIPQQKTDKVSCGIRYFKSEDVDDYVRVLSATLDEVNTPELKNEMHEAAEEIKRNYSMQTWSDSFKKLI